AIKGVSKDRPKGNKPINVLGCKQETLQRGYCFVQQFDAFDRFGPWLSLFKKRRSRRFFADTGTKRRIYDFCSRSHLASLQSADDTLAHERLHQPVIHYRRSRIFTQPSTLLISNERPLNPTAPQSGTKGWQPRDAIEQSLVETLVQAHVAYNSWLGAAFA